MTLKKFDVLLVDFGTDVIGSEQGGKRPAVVIQNDAGNLHSSTTIVLPLTTQQKKIHQPTHALIKKNVDNGLMSDSIVLAECIRQISKKRIKKYLGTINGVNEQSAIRSAYIANLGE